MESPARNMSKREQVHIGGDSGKVKVFVRVRPLSKEENINKAKNVLRVSEDKGQISLISDTRKTAVKVYQFDHVFGPSKTNHQVCAKVSQPIVDSALSGFNGTLMAYGQTGTGKTHTLMAPDGIAQSVIQKVFDQIQMDGSNDYRVSVAYLQIYQEKIHDLLNFNNKVELHIREKPKSGIFVENLTEYVIRSASEALSLLAFGKKRLIFAETKMNRTSSRSHSVFQLAIEKTPKKEKNAIEHIESKSLKAPTHNKTKESMVKMVGWDEDVIVKGKIHLCDLAGSERIKKTHAVGERLCEAQHINSSLLELGNVIQALADESSTHIPFRNSVLTRLLQESLGGNCKTSLIVCVSPGLKDASETKSSLNFGSRAMKVENIAYVNVEVDYKKLSESLLRRLEEYESELHGLRQEKTLIKELTEKTDLERRLEDVCRHSDDTMKSLKSAHVKEVEGLALRIKELVEDIKLKDEQIEKLSSEIRLLTEEKAAEENITKLLLMNEISSFEILSAAEFERLRSIRTHYNENLEIIVEAMLEHCQAMVNGARMFLPESIGSLAFFEPKELNDNEIDRKKGSNVWNDMKATLMKSKEDFEMKMKRICWSKKATQDLETPKDSMVWDLCKIFVEKGFFTNNLALENLELRQENELLKNEVKKFQSGIEMPEDFDESLKRTIKVQNDVDEKLSGFEVTLSKIEKMLSDKSCVQINKSKLNERSSCVANHQLNEQHVNRKLANPDEDDLIDRQLKDSSMMGKQHLMKSVTRKQEENLTEFVSDNKRKNSTKYEDETCKQADDKSMLKGVYLNDFGASKDDENNLISVALADAKEFSEILCQYFETDDAIKEVKAQIERHRSKHQKKYKKKDSIKSKSETRDPIVRESEAAGGAERKTIKELLARDSLNTNTACSPEIDHEMRLQAKVALSEYSLSPFLCLWPCRPICCGEVRLCSANNQFAHVYLDYISDNTLTPQCTSRASRMYQNNNKNGLLFDIRSKLYDVIDQHQFSDVHMSSENDSHSLRSLPFELGLSFVEINGLRNAPKDILNHNEVTHVLTQGIECDNSSDERKKLVNDVDLAVQLQSFGLFAGKCNSSSDSGLKSVLLENIVGVINSNEDCTQILTQKSYTEDDRNDFAETTCNISDEELNLRIESSINSYDSENEDIDIHIRRNRKEKEEIESTRVGNCSLLEVQIVSGSKGYSCYGDSFVSPLSKQAFGSSDVSEEKIPESNQNDLTVQVSLDEHRTSENVIIKTPWSFSKWLLGKRKKSKASTEKSVVCQ